MTPRRRAASPALAVLAALLPAGPAHGVIDPDNAPGRAGAPYAVVVLANADAGTFEPEIYCSGTLIAPDVVLTAAHCADGLDPSQLLVGAGSEDAASTVRHPVADLAVHPLFNPDLESWFEPLANDIAVLRLASPVTGIEPVRLAPVDDAPMRSRRSNLRAFGWGVDASGESTGVLGRAALLDVTGRIPSPYSDLDTERQILTSSRRGAQPCIGDSGGPLVGNRPGKKAAFLVGIISYGSQRCRSDMPVVHTRIAAHRQWILRTAALLRERVPVLRYRAVDRSWDAPEGTAVLRGELVSTRTYIQVTLNAPDLGQNNLPTLRLRLAAQGTVTTITGEAGRPCLLERAVDRKEGVLTWSTRFEPACLETRWTPGQVAGDVLAELVRDDGRVLEELHFTRVLLP